jgi:hypothetical protein
MREEARPLEVERPARSEAMPRQSNASIDREESGWERLVGVRGEACLPEQGGNTWASVPE